MENIVLQAISQSLESLANMVKDLDARVNDLEDWVYRPVAKVHNVEKSPLIVRHSRYIDGFGGVEARGGVTYVFELNYKKQTANVGIAVCSLKENFNKFIGRELAACRLNTDPIVFEYNAPNDVGLVDAFWDAVNLGDARVSKDNWRIINSIKEGDLV